MILVDWARTMHGALGTRLRKAGIGMSASAAIACIAGVGVALSGLAWVVLRTPTVLLIGPVAVGVIWRSAMTALDRRHLRRVADAMPSVALMLASAVAAGLSLRQAIVRAARDMPDPLGPELRAVSAELDLGGRVDDALAHLADRLPDPDLALLVTAILVQRRTGGDLARALRDMSSHLEERRRLAREVRGATAQARATAWMVAALPVLGAALAESASPGLMARTVGNGAGAIVLAGSVVLQAIGILLIRRIAAVDV